MINRIIKKIKADGFGSLITALRRPAINPVTVALTEICKTSDFVVVQLGAYVGDSPNDPLFNTLRERATSRIHKPPSHKIILVEPVGEYCEQLRGNYSAVPGVTIENSAISDRAGEASFYRLGVDPVKFGYPDWLSQLGSLKEERMGAPYDNYEANAEYKAFYMRHRVTERVNCITFNDLIERHQLTKIDLLQIDVEGFEHEIFKTIPWGSIPIRFINYESVLLGNAKVHCEQLLTRNGYRMVDYHLDTFCFKDADRSLSRSWKRRISRLQS